VVDEKKREKQRQERAFDEKGPLRLIIGPPMRLFVGILLITGTGIWVFTNDLLSKFPTPGFFSIPEKPQDYPIPLLDWLFNNHAPGFGGLILLISVVFKRRNIVWLSWPAAAVTLLGPVFLRTVVSADLAMWISIAVALILAGLGMATKR